MSANYDVIIIGGGIMGSSLARNLARDGFGGTIAVFEQDVSHERASTTLGVGGIRRQFSTAVNIRLSQYSLSVYRAFAELTEVNGDRPEIAFRVPLFNELKLIRGWAGLYEMNLWDYNGIIAACPELAGFYLAVGFSGHGFQQAPAAGKALSELIRLGRYETIDVSDLSYERIGEERKVLEEEAV